MSKKDVIEGIEKMHEELMKNTKIIANDRMTNDVNVAISRLNEVLEEVWGYNFRVDIYLDKDDKVCPVFYE